GPGPVGAAARLPSLPARPRLPRRPSRGSASPGLAPGGGAGLTRRRPGRRGLRGGRPPPARRVYDAHRPRRRRRRDVLRSSAGWAPARADGLARRSTPSPALRPPRPDGPPALRTLGRRRLGKPPAAEGDLVGRGERPGAGMAGSARAAQHGPARRAPSDIVKIAGSVPWPPRAARLD